jgi:hypothetical protein
MNGFQIKAFVNKIKTNNMNMINVGNGQFVVIDNSPIIVGEGYCLDTDNNEVVYYNGNYGDEAPSFLKKITHSFPKLAGTVEITDFGTKPGFVEKRMAQFADRLKSLKVELEELKVYEPVNGMGKWGKQVMIDKLTREINELESNPFIDDPNEFTTDMLNEESVLSELTSRVISYDYNHTLSDYNGFYTSADRNQKIIVELIGVLIGICRMDAEQLMEDLIAARSEQFPDGLTHNTIRGWFQNYL